MKFGKINFSFSKLAQTFRMLLLNATEVFPVSLYFMEKMAKLAKMEKHFNISFFFRVRRKFIVFFGIKLLYRVEIFSLVF